MTQLILVEEHERIMKAKKIIKIDRNKNYIQEYGVASYIDRETREVLFVGGLGGCNEGSKSCLLYNLKINMFKKLPPLPEGRVFGAVVIKKYGEFLKKVFVIGGMESGGGENVFLPTFSTCTFSTKENEGFFWETVDLEDFEECKTNVYYNSDDSHEFEPSFSSTVKFLEIPSLGANEEKLVFFGWCGKNLDSNDFRFGNVGMMFVLDLERNRCYKHFLPEIVDGQASCFGCFVGKYYYCMKEEIPSPLLDYSEELVESTMIRVNVLNPKKWEIMETRGNGPDHTHLSNLVTIGDGKRFFVCFGGSYHDGSVLNLFNDLSKTYIHLFDTKKGLWMRFVVEADFEICRFGFSSFSLDNKFFFCCGVYSDMKTVDRKYEDICCIDFSSFLMEETDEINDRRTRIDYLVKVVDEISEEKKQLKLLYTSFSVYTILFL